MYVTLIPLFSASKVSFSDPITFSMDVDPSVATDPVICFPQPVNIDITTTEASADENILFVFIIKISFSFYAFLITVLLYRPKIKSVTITA